jgi:hypothetical protein
MPAKIRNSVPEKYQAKPMRIAKDTVAMPPAVIAQVRSLRARSRVWTLASAGTGNPFRVRSSTLSSNFAWIKQR